MKRSDDRGGLVYTTDAGRMCPVCRQPVAECRCRKVVDAPVGDGIVRVSRETAGRAGKGVTVIRGIALEAERLTALAKRLKAACATGGTVKSGVLELQGDHADRVVAWLRAEGWTVKRAGG